MHASQVAAGDWLKSIAMEDEKALLLLQISSLEAELAALTTRVNKMSPA